MAAPIEAGVPASVASALIGLIALVFAVLTIPSDEAVPDSPSDENPREQECNESFDEDNATCRTLKSKAARARCFSSAMTRYANCLGGTYQPPLVIQ